MAANDIRVIKHGFTVQRLRTESNTEVGLNEGDAVKIGGTGVNYAVLCLDGDPEQGTDIFLGVTRGTSTNTTTADGTIDVELCVSGTILEILANTPGSVNTDAELLLLLLDVVSFDRSAATVAGILTLDEDEGSDAAGQGFMILDARITDGMMFITPIRAWIGAGTHAA